VTVTFVDTGVLIAASRGEGDIARGAMAVLDDARRTFASSVFVKLEALPMPTFHRREAEIAFMNAFFDRVEHWPGSEPVFAAERDALFVLDLVAGEVRVTRETWRPEPR
jgi:hypothetical protein